MKTLLVFFFFISTFVHADEVADLALAFGGLQRVPIVDQSRIEFRLKDRITYSISKSRFQKRSEAVAFCEDIDMKLADEVAWLGLAMVMGEGENQNTISLALETRIEGPEESMTESIAWAPHPREDGDIFIFEGVDPQYASYESIKPYVAGIPALCTKTPETENAGVNNSDRSIVPDKSERPRGRDQSSGSGTTQQ